MSASANELAPRWPVPLGRAGRSGLAPSALAIDLPTALGTSARGKPGEARLLITASMSSATSTAPALVRTLRFTAPPSRDGPLRTVTYSLGIRDPDASATTSTWVSVALIRRCWSDRTLSAATRWRAAHQAAATSAGPAAFLARTGAAAVWRPAAAARRRPDRRWPGRPAGSWRPPWPGRRSRTASRR